VYDGQNIVLSFDGSGTQTHRYLHGTGVDQVLADENAQGTLWTLADHQGSIRDVLDNTGTLQNHIVYDSFGKITSQTNASATTIYGYTGREYDSETGLYFYRARYYDPSTGGFISEDPIGFEAGDYNLYRYVGNSPTNFNDPSGLIFDTILDVGFIAYDLYKIAKDNIFGNCDNLGENLLALGADVAGALVPFATGGGAAIRAGKAANQALDAARAADRATDAARGIDRAADASKGLDRAGDAAKSSNVADTQKALNPTNCFIAGTEIITRDGTKNIEDIQIGDWVLADDPNTVGEIEYKQVLQTFARSATETIDIYIDGEKITTTEEHPFWVPGVGWVAAKDLNVGTHLQTKTESWLDIDKIESHTSPTNVYNFEVEGFHTYFVSDLGLLVHNTCNTNNLNSRGHSNDLLPGEGNVGRYKDLNDAGVKGDNITPHHIPSNKHMQQHGVSTNDGIAINMEQYYPSNTGRHTDTFTYGSRNKNGLGDVNMSPRDALAAGIRDARDIYQKDGLYNDYTRGQLQDLIRQNKQAYPSIFQKR
jgi:RHS repeat-associated protein